MLVLILQSALLIAIAFILGCILGCLLRSMFGSDSGTGTVAASAGVAAATAAAATQRPSAEPAPAPKPEPVAKPAPKPAPEAKPEPVALMSSGETVATKPKPAAKKPAAKKPAAPEKPAAPKPAPAGEGDNLKLIKGVGRQNEARLNALGVNRFAQIAKWSKKDQETWGERLAFPGRIEREDWVGQAKVLAEGGSTKFASRVRRGAVSSSTGKGTVGEVGKKPRVLKEPRAGGADNLTLIDGVGNAIEKKMFALGIFHFDQIAKMTPEQVVWLSNSVGFPGRAERENWVGEAKILAEGGTTAHAQRVEEGKIATSRKSTKAEKKKS